MSGITTTFTSTHDVSLHGCGESIAAATDNNPAENVKPFAFCSHICGACTPVPLAVSFGGRSAGPWFATAKSATDTNEEMLTEESFFQCKTGANAKVEFVDPGQDCIYLGDIKPLRQLLEERGELIANSPLTKEDHDHLQALDNEILSRIPYNQAQFTSSHNSYATISQDGLTIAQQMNGENINSVELDFRTGNPYRVGKLDTSPDDDFCVYHSSVDVPGFRDTQTPYDDIDEYKHDPWWTNGCVVSRPLLNEIKNVPTNQPVTIFIDLKNGVKPNDTSIPSWVSGDYRLTSNDLNNLLKDELGDRLYTPSDGSSPSMLDMQNKIVVVLTDDTENYQNDFSASGSNPAAFVAQTNLDNIIQNPSSMVFYNTSSKDLDESVIAEIQANNGLLRTYGFDPNNFQAGVDYGTNFLGVDHVKEEWNDLAEYGFPFKVNEGFLMVDEHQTMGQEGKLAVISGATLTCPKAVMGSDIKFFRMNK